ncbi:MAG TPA: pyridoxal kinase PdxY [Candidatus Sulfotelmatobacter sp.]|jgi:pyridoxine kinase|nr:pyridoxal kinase PdxY [Candidatus Sulfotelmatobacter sp.]
MNILSIQSSVAFGHVGNSAAVFPLQRLGHEVWPINTVQFSNHTGYGVWTGQVFPAAHLSDLLNGIQERNALPGCHGLLTGYMGDASIGEVVLDALARLRTANPQALYCCDPVMGDEGRGIFVRPDIPAFFAERLLPRADILTPNQFELELLSQRKVASRQDAVDAARSLISRGPRLVCVTSLRPPALTEGTIGTLLVSADHAWLASTPLLDFPIAPNGAGDVFAALFLGHLLKGAEPPKALEQTVGGLFALLKTTLSLKQRELALVAAQADLIQPPGGVTVAPVD